MPQMANESLDAFEARLKTEAGARVDAAMSRLDELRGLRASLAHTQFAADAAAFIKSKGGDPAEMDQHEAAEATRRQKARDDAEAARAAARAEAAATRAERLDTLSVQDMRGAELADWERQHGLSSSRY